MAMISYAQNREDVRLARVLTASNGFYIDVGAGDPTVHSLTRHFFDRGWRGVNVEPRDAPFAALRQHRPSDVNLQLALADEEGDLSFYEPERKALGELATCAGCRAGEYRKLGYDVVERRLPATTLARVCAQYAPPRIDFLSIDVEGEEAAVIRGGDWTRWRPRIVVIEAIAPFTHEPACADWESLLFDVDYMRAADDGINRFYVPREESTAADALAKPMSWLDRYEPYEYVSEIERLRGEVLTAGGASGAARTLVESAEQQAAAVWAGYDGMREELVRLRNRVEAFDRSLAGYGSPATIASSISAHTHAGLPGLDGIGPVWLALAARMTHVSRRYPKLATTVKEQVLRTRRVVRRVTKR